MSKYIFRMILCLLLISITVNAQYQKVTSNSLEIYYRTFGEGEPLLIIGGGPGDLSDRYLSLCDLLKEDVQCILVDQRGTGKSMPEVLDTSSISIQLTLEDFEAIREKLGYEKWNVLGFSYGGYLASLYAHFFPSSINSVVLLNSLGLNTDAFAYFRDNIISRMSTDDIKLMEFWSDSTRLAQDPNLAITEKIRAMMPGYFYDREKSLLVSQDIKLGDFNFEMGKYIWNDVVSRNLDLVEMGANYNGSVLILQGRQDPLGTLIAKRSSDYYSNSKLVFVEKAGHYSWIEQPETVRSEIASFIK